MAVVATAAGDMGEAIAAKLTASRFTLSVTIVSAVMLLNVNTDRHRFITIIVIAATTVAAVIQAIHAKVANATTASTGTRAV